MIQTNHEFLDIAMKSYNNPGCITIGEFNRDLNSYVFIKKGIRKYMQEPDRLRSLVNQLVIFYNCFGTIGTDLLLFKIVEEDILAILLPIILYLGRSTPSVDALNITLNIDVISHLNEL